jgi:hypothetical protein
MKRSIVTVLSCFFSLILIGLGHTQDDLSVRSAQIKSPRVSTLDADQPASLQDRAWALGNFLEMDDSREAALGLEAHLTKYGIPLNARKSSYVRQSETAAFFLRNSNTGGVADITFTYAPAGMVRIPIVGDWDGDGTDTIGIYNPQTAAFFLRNSITGCIADITFTYGPAGIGFVALAGDWDVDGVDTIGLYNPPGAAFFLRNSNTGGIADITFTYGPAGMLFKPLVGDWDGL